MAKSLTNQITLLQRETTPGVAAVNAMKRLSAIGMTPGWNVSQQDFTAQGYKLPTVIQETDQSGVWAVDGVQDYNHLGLVAASRIAMPVTTTPSGGTLSRQHVFSLVPNAEDTKATYSAQFGDTSRAVQGVYGVFQSLGINIQRGQLSFDSSFISRTPSVISSVATSGVTTMAASPTSPKQFDIWADDTWAGLGGTQLLAAYEGGIDLGDKFAMDSPINSANASYESVIEADGQSYDGTLRVGFDTTATGLITTWGNAALKFLRIKALGPIIEGAIRYSFQLDLAAQIRNPGNIERFGNGVMTLPFDFSIVPDPTSSNALVLTLVNTVTAY